MSKVVLINLPIQSYFQRGYIDDHSFNPALGLMSIATFLRFNGIEADVYDFCYIKMQLKDFIMKVKDQNPVLICMCVYTENFDMAVETANVIKSELPYVKIAFGGPHPTLFPEESISGESVDFVIRKEGEPIFLELYNALETQEELIKYDQITGLVFKRAGKVIKNKLRNHIKNLDLLPMISREIAGIENYRDTVNIYTSKGCPGRCIYCSASALSGCDYRTRSIDNVYLEVLQIRYITNNDEMNVYIVDDTFTAYPERVKRFAGLVKENNIKLRWHCESRIDVMNTELLDIMKESGCVAVQYGIESGSQEVLDKIKKKIDLNYAKKIIEETAKRNMIPILSFMLGHFCDTKETLQQTADFIKFVCENYDAEAMLSFNTPFPGTWQHTHKDEIGIRIMKKNYKNFSLLTPIVETDNFTLNDQRVIYNSLNKYLFRRARQKYAIK